MKAPIETYINPIYYDIFRINIKWDTIIEDLLPRDFVFSFNSGDFKITVI